MRAIFFFAAFALSLFSFGQKKKNIEPTTPDQRKAGYEQRLKLQQESKVQNIPFRCIGPTIMGGRVVDLDVDPKNPEHFYVAYATGGLWVTWNNGTTFEPLFQNQIVMTIGDIAIDWKNNETIWIGSGENNSSRSSYSGFGIFKGEWSKIPAPSKKGDQPLDQSIVWTNKGLNDSHHIGRIILHPNNPNTIWVAGIGHLYSSSKEQGVFKSNDGGNTWQHQLNIDGAGAIDLVIDPENPDLLAAAIWERSRAAWQFNGSGSKSAIHLSQDGGASWKNITQALGGTAAIFPQGEGVGRIGLAIYHDNNAHFLYAMVDNQHHREKEKPEEKPALTKNDFEKMSKEQFLKLDQEQLQTFLTEYGFPEKYSAEYVTKEIREDRIKPIALYDYLYDADNDLFVTPVIGAQVYRFDFSTQQWKKTHEGYLDDVVYTYGYYFGLIRVHPTNPDKLYIAGVPLLTSDDGGKNWRIINPENVHVDHHALWIDPNVPGHLINGSDGGVQISYDDGKTFTNCIGPEVGQFYAITVDNSKPYKVYGGLQDNGVWAGPHTNVSNRNWYQSGQYPFNTLMGGDGMQIQVDPRNNTTVYTGYQFGNYYRIEKSDEDPQLLHIQHELGEKPLRWNWQTPILLSSANPDILYMCSNRVHQSLDQGEHFTPISGDLTKGAKEGNVPFGTITSISESPFKFGQLVVGTDDGNVHYTLDMGNTWHAIAPISSTFWVSRVLFSEHKKERIYVALNGYRNDHFEAMVYVSDDYGKTWNSISTSLPTEPVNVIREDPRSEKILYVGTDHGAYCSIDGGKSWMPFVKNLPAVPVHDIAIQKQELDIVLGTHGRSIWIADIEEIGALDSLSRYIDCTLPLSNIDYDKNWGEKFYTWEDAYTPSITMTYYSLAKQNVHYSIITPDQELVYESNTDVVPGINYIDYHLQGDEKVLKNLAEKQGMKKYTAGDDGQFYLVPGKYYVLFGRDKFENARSFEVLKK